MDPKLAYNLNLNKFLKANTGQKFFIIYFHCRTNQLPLPKLYRFRPRKVHEKIILKNISIINVLELS